MIEKLVPCESAIFGGWLDEEGVHHESEEDYLFCYVLPSCGCGDPSTIGRYVRDMLRRHVGHNGEGTEYEDLPTMFFLSWADREEYIEHGTTIRCSWLTAKGEELLRELDAILGKP